MKYIPLKIILVIVCIFNAFLSYSAEKEKTFKTIIEKAVYLDGGHDSYSAFADNEFKVFRVTNLNSTGEGSFTWAVSQKGPRIVVFEVGGVIDLKGESIKILEPYLFVAGQTAPNPGITVIKGGMTIAADHVIMQHITIRTGDGLQNTEGKKWEKDAVTTSAAHNVVVDHCSLTWATDENLSASGPRHRPNGTSRSITFSNNIISEGLCRSTHSKGKHSMGTLIHDYVADIAIVKNLYASNNERNPFVKTNAHAYIANNLVYNPAHRAIHSSWPVEEYTDCPETMRMGEIAVVGNVMIPGPDTPDTLHFVLGPLRVYSKDNMYIKTYGNKRNVKNRVLSPALFRLSTSPVPEPVYEVMKAKDVPTHVLDNVGSRPAHRTEIDKRIISDVINNTGKIIDSQTEREGYPNYVLTRHELQIPERNVEQWLAELSDKMIK